MREEQRIDYGSIHIHKKALGDIVAAVIEETEGMSLAPDNVAQRFLRFFHRNNILQSALSLTVKMRLASKPVSVSVLGSIFLRHHGFFRRPFEKRLRKQQIFS